MARLIDADRLLKAFCGHCDAMTDDNVCMDGGDCFDKQLIECAPTVDAVPVKHGRWIKLDTSEVYDMVGVKTWALKAQCSECSWCTKFVEAHMCYNYCPNCGADMRGSTNE